MKTYSAPQLRNVRFLLLLAMGASVAFATIGRAQNASPAPATSAATAGQPNDAEMMKQMMELSKLNANHKLLASLDGTWNYTVKLWMGDPNAAPVESKGVAVRKSMMDGRYFTEDVTGKMEAPGPDGKVKPVTFRGHGLDAYDNAKQKFTSTWVDNMGTGITMSEGTYDEASKMFTYTGDMQMGPGMTEKLREVLKLTDKNHMVMEYYEDRGKGEAKTMEIDYTRAK